MTPTTCTIGECRRPATLRLEIRRRASDKHPAEVRPICKDPLCLTIARMVAGDFHTTVV